MTAEVLQQLLDYHYWARDRLLDAVAPVPPEDFTRDLGSSFASVRDTLVHIYAAEVVWCSRWQGTSPSAMVPAGAFADLVSLRAAWKEHEATMRAVVADFARTGVDRTVEYRDLRGNAWRQVFWEMLLHVVNHASYHRGQVTTMLRQLHAAPPASMDLVAFFRTRA